MKRRILSMLLVLCFFASTIYIYSLPATATEQAMSPDMAILENILYGDRHFVIDTLIGTNYKTDFSTNPHAIVNYIGDENTMMDNVLTQYQTDRAYKAAVDIMEKVYNSDEYAESVTDFVTEFAADLLNNFSTDASNFASDLTYSKSQLNYESILKEVLQADYTASDGTKLSSKEIELKELERIEKSVKNLKTFADFFKNSASANHMNDDTFDDRMSYYNDYLLPYTDSMEDTLNAFAEMQDTPHNQEENVENLIKLTTGLAMLAQMDRYEIANEEISSDIVYYAPTFFIDDDTLSVIKSGDKAISTISKTLSAYMFVNEIAIQNDSVKDALERMSRTANPSLKPVLIDFAGKIGEAGNAKLIGYESLMQYIRNQGVVTEIASDGLSNIGSKLQSKLEKSVAFSNAGLASTAVSKAFASAANVVNISSWCADKTMSFGATCKKTYELKYLRTLIAQAIVTYQDDLNTYLSNKTEGNAKNVLDDLMMIQKLRLRGEKIAHDMTEGQWNSPLGRLLATGTLNADEMLMKLLDESYQARVDAFIGASPMPLSTDSLTVGNGETLDIIDRNDVGLFGTMTKADGASYSIGELQYRIANGITVASGGTVRSTASDRNAYIPYITNSGGTVWLGNNIKFGEYSQTSGETVLYAQTQQIDNVYLSGGNFRSNSATTLNCDNITVSNVNLNNILINATDAVSLTSTTVQTSNNSILRCNQFSGNGITLGNIDISANTVSTSGTSSLNSITSKMINQSNGTLMINGNVNINGDSYFGGTVNHTGNYTTIGDISGSTINLGNFNLCGKVPQTISGTITVNDFLNNNAKGLTVNSTVNVKGKARSVKAPTNGQYITLIDSASFADSTYKGDVTIKGLAGELPARIYGKVYLSCNLNQESNTQFDELQISSGTLSADTCTLKGQVILNGGNISLTDSNLTIQGYLNNSSSSSTITVDDTSTLNVTSDTIIYGKLTGSGTFSTKGDITNSGTIDIGNLILTANVPISVSGNNITVQNLTTNGTRKITLNNRINITNSSTINNKNINTDNIVFQNGYSVNENTSYNTDLNVTGDLVIDGKTVTANKNLKVTNGSVVLKNGAKLIVKGRTEISGSSSYSINIDETSTAELKKLSIISSMGSIKVNGTLTFGSDVSLSSTALTGSGTINLVGDLYASSVTINKPKNFNIIGKLPQTISASGAEFDNLTISNPCRAGVTFSSTVYYSGTYDTGSSKITGTVTKR